jgi:hypothetical protein
MKERIGLLLLMFFMGNYLPALAQTNNVIPYYVNNGGQKWEIDPLGNLYVYSGYDLHKVDSLGLIVQSFSSRDFGQISSIDVSNPFSPMLVYSLFNTVVELDKSFSMKSKWSFPLTNFTVDQLVCRIPGQGYWLFDAVNGRPILLDSQAKILSEGTALATVHAGKNEVLSMMASDDFLMLNVKNLGLLVFDRYGTFVRKILGPNILACGFTGSDFYYVQDNIVFRYDYRKGTSIETLTVQPGDEVKISNGRIFMQRNKVILRYIP